MKWYIKQEQIDVPGNAELAESLNMTVLGFGVFGFCFLMEAGYGEVSDDGN